MYKSGKITKMYLKFYQRFIIKTIKNNKYKIHQISSYIHNIIRQDYKKFNRFSFKKKSQSGSLQRGLQQTKKREYSSERRIETEEE